MKITALKKHCVTSVSAVGEYLADEVKMYSVTLILMTEYAPEMAEIAEADLIYLMETLKSLQSSTKDIEKLVNLNTKMKHSWNEIASTI